MFLRLALLASLALSASAWHRHTSTRASKVHQAALARQQQSSVSGHFLMVTDPHLDIYYEVGSHKKTMCHRETGGGAQEFGERNLECDTPNATISSVMDFATTLDVDFVLYGGDSARHDHDSDFPRTEDEVSASRPPRARRAPPGLRPRPHRVSRRKLFAV